MTCRSAHGKDAFQHRGADPARTSQQPLVASFVSAIIPFTKLRHLFTTSANYLFVDLGPKGQLPTIDMEDEEAESFGAGEISQLSWKDIFDADACTSCKRCQDRCPAFNTGKPLSPRKIRFRKNQASSMASTTPMA